MTRISSIERDAAHHLAHRAPDDRPDRLLLVERRQDQRDRHALLLLELDQAAEVGELGVVEVRFGEPALDPGGDGAGLLGGAIGGRERLGLRGAAARTSPGRSVSRVFTTMTVGFARLAIASGSAPNSVGRRRRRRRLGRRAHHDEVGALGLAQDRVADVRAPRHEPRPRPLQVLADELGEGVFGLGADGGSDPGRDEVEDVHRRRRGARRSRRHSAAPARRGVRRGPARGSAGSSARRAA